MTDPREQARAAIENLVAEEVAKAGSKAHEVPGLIGRNVANRMLEEGDDVKHSTDGCGVWLRKVDDFDPGYFVEHLDFGVLPLMKGTRRINRSSAWKRWTKAVIASGRPMWGMDWGPSPDGWTPESLDEGCRYAADQGFVGMMADNEPDFGWHGAAQVPQAEAYGRTLAEACDRHGLLAGYTNYGRHSPSSVLFEVFLKWLPIGFPQGYDPAGRYQPSYLRDTYDFWAARGAEHIVMGIGLWLRSADRCRTPEELLRHLEYMPKEVRGVCGWYASTRSCLNPALYDILRDYTPPGLAGDGVRTFLEALVPLGGFRRS